MQFSFFNKKENYFALGQKMVVDVQSFQVSEWASPLNSKGEKAVKIFHGEHPSVIPHAR